MNPILMTDSYKLAHWNQYPADTQGIFSYFESRPGAAFHETVFFGLQPIIERYLCQQIRSWDVNDAKALVDAHMGPGVFNEDGWNYIVQELRGRLPIEIKAVPEGTVVPVGNVMMTVENTDPNCFWLTNYIESLLTHVWYPSTVATLSRTVKKVIAKALEMSSDDASGLDFMLHDFGYRGVSSHESGQFGGAAHLVNFKGTDTIAGIQLVHDSYAMPYEEIGFSVPATEHSVMTAKGKIGEFSIVDSLLGKYPSGILSLVADSYNIYDFVDYCIAARSQVLNRDGVLVIRPDSITDEHKTPEDLVVALLNRFPADLVSTNSKGYKQLDPHYKILWGDGIDIDGIQRILVEMIANGWAASNIATFGMGGGLLQKVNRDTQRFAFKCSARLAGDEWIPISKNPLDTSKASKAGRLALVEGISGHLTTVVGDPGPDNLLKTVYKNGTHMKTYKFADIRERAAI